MQLTVLDPTTTKPEAEDPLERERPGWREKIASPPRFLGPPPPLRPLQIACGTFKPAHAPSSLCDLAGL